MPAATLSRTEILDEILGNLPEPARHALQSHLRPTPIPEPPHARLAPPTRPAIPQGPGIADHDVPMELTGDVSFEYMWPHADLWIHDATVHMGGIFPYGANVTIEDSTLHALPGYWAAISGTESRIRLRNVTLEQVSVHGDDVEASALVVRGGTLGASEGRMVVEDVDLDGSINVFLADVTVRDATIASGSRIFGYASTLLVERAAFPEPDPDVWGGGLFGYALQLTVRDSTFPGNAAMPWYNPLGVYGPSRLEVTGSTFTGASVSLGDGGPHLLAGNTFRDGATGVRVNTGGAELRGNRFVNVTEGIVVAAFQDFDKGPEVHNNTFEANDVGIYVLGKSAGEYHHNVARGNYVGIKCESKGWLNETSLETLHPTFRSNNLRWNVGDALMGLTGVTIPTPVVDLVFEGSACDYDRTYLGPAGAERDSVFIGKTDTFTNVQDAENAVSAPATTLPLTVIRDATTWSGDIQLDGPVVVDAEGHLAVRNATLRGHMPIGAKLNGRITLDNTTVHPEVRPTLRNEADLVKASTFLARETGAGLRMHRCNCTLQDSTLYASGYAMAVLLQGGMYADDPWRPSVLRNAFHGPGSGVGALDMKPTVRGNTFDGVSGGMVALFSTTTLDDNAFVHAGVGAASILGTLTSTSNTFEDGIMGLLVGLDNDSSTGDLFAGNQIGLFGLLPIGPPAVTLANFTFNLYGMQVTLGAYPVTSSNFVDNFHAAVAAVPTALTDLPEIPTSATCTSCWMAPDESWYGNVTVGPQALTPNAVGSPTWAAQARRVLDGETLDLEGALEGPVVARSGGTIRVRNATLDLAQHPIGTKGGGMDGSPTGALDIDHARIEAGGIGGFVALNSTGSRITSARFAGFYQAGLEQFWHGFELDCVAFEDSTHGVRVSLTDGSDVVRVERLRVVGPPPGQGSQPVAVEVATRGLVRDTANVDILDSGVAQAAMLDRRDVAGNITLHASNLVGDARISDSQQDPENATPIDATNVWWDLYGPGWKSWGQPMPLTEPYAETWFAPEPCVDFEVVTPAPADDAPVVLRDIGIDPSVVSASDTFFIGGFPGDAPPSPDTRVWDLGDGTTATTTSPEIAHRFPDGGTYTVTLNYTSASGASGSATREVTVAHTKPLPGFHGNVLDETQPVGFADLSSHGNPNDAPPEGWVYDWDFGDGNASAAREPSHRFADGGAHRVTLDVTDDDGFANHTETTLQVPHVAPVAGIDVLGALETDTFQLRDASTHPNAPYDAMVAWSWSCSDGFASAQRNAAHKFADGGAYACSHDVTDDDGLGGAAQAPMTVAHVPPTSAFDAAVVDELTAVRFTDTSTHPNAPVDSPIAWSWDLGDGTASDARHPTRRYADGGTYAVTLTVGDDDGQGSERRRDIVVPHVAPRPAFGWAPDLPDPGEEVAFADASAHPNAPTDAIVAWQWDFGDGTTSAEASPRHTYAERAVYNVTLTLTDDDGQVAKLLRRVAIGNAPPNAAFSLAPEEPTDLDLIAFTDESSDEDGVIVSWAWDFGDGTTSDAANVTHRYADNGVYVLSLTVTDDLGASTTLVRELLVRNVPPTANFTLEPQQPVVGLETTFVDASTDPDGTIVSWAWDFGDGATSMASSPTHTYAEGGDYEVRLTVTDDDGDATLLLRVVHVCETGVLVEEGHVRVEVCPVFRLQDFLGSTPLPPL